MSTENVDIVVTEKGSEQAAANVSKVGTAAEETAKQTEAMNAAFEKVQRGIEALGLIEIAKSLIEITDSFTTLNARLGAVTTSTENLRAVQAALVEMSDKTRTSFEANATFFTKAAQEAEHLGVSQKELIELQTLLNQSFIASGATGKQAAAGLEQLERAFAQGSLSGRPLINLLKEFPVTAKALAAGLGVPITAIQGLAEKGGISIKQFTDALSKSADIITSDFEKIPVTIGGAFDVLKDRVAIYIAQADQQYGISQKVAQGLLLIADNIPTLVAAIKTLIEAWALFKAATLAGDIYGKVVIGLGNMETAMNTYIAAQTAGGLQATKFGVILAALNSPISSITNLIRELWVAIAANPIGAILLVIGLLVIAIINWGDKIVLVNDKINGNITLLGALKGIITSVAEVVVNTINAFARWTQGLGTFGDVLSAVSGKGVDFAKNMREASKAAGDAKSAADGLSTSSDNLGTSLGNTAKGINGVVVGGTQMGRVTAANIPPFENLKIAGDRLNDMIAKGKKAFDDNAQAVKSNSAALKAAENTTRDAMGHIVTYVDEADKETGRLFDGIQTGAAASTTAVDGLANSFSNAADAAGALNSATQTLQGGRSVDGGGGGGLGGAQNLNPMLAGGVSTDNGQTFHTAADDIAYFKSTGRPIGTSPFTIDTPTPWNELLAEIGQNDALIAAVNAAAHARGVPGFANGTEFQVGGSGGVDSQLVSFMASPDEVVTVRNKNQQRRGQGGGGQTINMTVVTKDANSFRRSTQQVLLATKSKLATV